MTTGAGRITCSFDLRGPRAQDRVALIKIGLGSEPINTMRNGLALDERAKVVKHLRSLKKEKQRPNVHRRPLRGRGAGPTRRIRDPWHCDRIAD